MERLTKKEHLAGHTVNYVGEDDCFDIWSVPKKFIGNAIDRLAAIEDILGAEYDLDRLRELAQADNLIGKNVYEANKRGFISTYKIISIHISECSVLVGWELLDGIYSNLNGFEISALGKTVFLTREQAEAALQRGQDNG